MPNIKKNAGGSEDKLKGATAPAAQGKAKAPVVLIWNMPRVRLIHVPVSADQAKGRAVSKSIRLNPGKNDISAESWAVLQGRKDIQKQIQKGELRLVKDQEGEPLQRVPRNLEKLSEDEAVVLVENTMDESLLHSWEKGETREAVTKAIKEQLEKLASAFANKEE